MDQGCDVPQVYAQAGTEYEIDDEIFAGERDRRVRSVLRQGVEPFTFPPANTRSLDVASCLFVPS
jgi:hypothetical protein